MDTNWNLLFEGCDCVGKTSSINKISSLFKQVIKSNAPKDYIQARRYNENLVTYLNVNYGIITDRAILSEEIYAPLKRGYNVEYMRELEEQLLPHNVLVLLTADLETIKKRFDNIFLTVDELDIINKRFLEVFDKTRYKHKILIDTSNITSQDVADKIISYLESIKNGNNQL